MNLLDKVGEGLTNSVDFLVEKNRQLAQLNRLSAVIRTETDVINRAYIALGKQYFKILEGTAEENDMSQICEVIKFSEERLKKAQARYDYVKVYGVPASPVDSMEMNRTPDSVYEDEELGFDEEPAQADIEEDENADITIAVVGEDAPETESAAQEAAENADEAAAETEEASARQDEEDTERIISEKTAETMNYLKKKRSRKSADDNEAAND